MTEDVRWGRGVQRLVSLWFGKDDFPYNNGVVWPSAASKFKRPDQASAEAMDTFHNLPYFRLQTGVRGHKKSIDSALAKGMRYT